VTAEAALRVLVSQRNAYRIAKVYIKVKHRAQSKRIFCRWLAGRDRFNWFV